MELSLEDVLDRALRGEHSALTKLVDTLAPTIQMRIVKALVRWGCHAGGRSIRPDVEDLTQDVFARLFDDDAKLLRNWDPARGLSLDGYVGLIAHRYTMRVLHNRKRSPMTEQPAGEDLDRLLDGRAFGGSAEVEQTSLCPESRVISKDLFDELYHQLEQTLSPLGLHVFELVYLEQRSVAEVCEKLNTSANAVYAWRSRLARRVESLLAELMAEAPVPAAPSEVVDRGVL